MRHGFAFLSRVAIWGGAALLAAATLLGRSERRPPPRPPTSLREPASPRYHAFDFSLFREHGLEPRLLDTETGGLGALEFSGAGNFDKLSFSPWRDADGRHHVVGHWQELAGRWGRRPPGAAGLARWTYPGGRLLGRITSDVIPVSPPCWSPDRSDRVVFAATDGRLYLLDFRDAADLDGEMAGPRPQEIRWASPPAGAYVIMILDPCWPTISPLGGCLLASVCWCAPDAQPGSLARSELWWLQLSPSATEIVAAGRLIVPDEGEPEPGEDEYAPGVGMTSDGVPLLAYLAGPRNKDPQELRLAPITLAETPTGRVPRVRVGATRRLASANIPTAPAFSPDGRWLYAVVQSRVAGGLTIKRIAVAPDGRHGAPVELGATSGPGVSGRIGGGFSRPPGDRG